MQVSASVVNLLGIKVYIGAISYFFGWSLRPNLGEHF